MGIPSLNKGATIFYTGTNENRLLRRKSLKKRTEYCLRSTGVFFILPQIYLFFLWISRNFVSLDYYARKIAHFALVNIDFLLDAMRFFCPYLINGLKKL